MGLFITAVLRLLVPFTILRYPIGGVIACIFADMSDVVIGYKITPEPWPWTRLAFTDYYAYFDKAFDTYYLTFAFFVSQRWTSALARRTSLVLYLWRLTGVALLFAGLKPWILLVFPNVFETFYLIYAITDAWKPSWKFRTGKGLALTLLIATAPKLAQEYYFHARDTTLWPWFERTFLS
jgi:hypothetical protein